MFQLSYVHDTPQTCSQVWINPIFRIFFKISARAKKFVDEVFLTKCLALNFKTKVGASAFASYESLP